MGNVCLAGLGSTIALYCVFACDFNKVEPCCPCNCCSHELRECMYPSMPRSSPGKITSCIRTMYTETSPRWCHPICIKYFGPISQLSQATIKDCAHSPSTDVVYTVHLNRPSQPPKTTLTSVQASRHRRSINPIFREQSKWSHATSCHFRHGVSAPRCRYFTRPHVLLANLWMAPPIERVDAHTLHARALPSIRSLGFVG